MIRVALFLLFAAFPAFGAELKLATWNLNWLTLKQAGLPPDVVLRAPEDFARLAEYAVALNADAVALQEVASREAAEAVFPRDRYSIHLTRDRVMQRVGWAIRRGLRYDIHPDYAALAGPPEVHLRSGADITLHWTGGDIRVLAVHLKQGCQYLPLANSQRRACVELRDQMGPLKDWIAARRQEGIGFAVAGDFNRGMEGRDPFLAALRQIAPLLRATEGKANPCWGGETFIDHILLGGPAAQRLVPDSLRVLRYKETDPAWKTRLSDHCPVSAVLAAP